MRAALSRVCAPSKAGEARSSPIAHGRPRATAGCPLRAPARAVCSLVTELFSGARKQNPAFGTVGGVLKKPSGIYAARAFSSRCRPIAGSPKRRLVKDALVDGRRLYKNAHSVDGTSLSGRPGRRMRRSRPRSPTPAASLGTPVECPPSPPSALPPPVRLRSAERETKYPLTPGPAIIGSSVPAATCATNPVAPAHPCEAAKWRPKW
jgi:hypothetical protein